MGIGITKDNVYTKWEIPLVQGELSRDDINDWSDNSWIVEHLRQLANKIERENPKIINIGLRTDYHYKAPQLCLDVIERPGTNHHLSVAIDWWNSLIGTQKAFYRIQYNFPRKYENGRPVRLSDDNILHIWKSEFDG